jgi:hypothetical protein
MASFKKKQKISNNRAPLSNFMEELACDVLDGLLPKYRGVRFSSGAIRDIKALALNRLWPMYTTTDFGKDFLKKIVAEDKIEKDVVRELRAAIEIVRANPRS